MPGYRAFFGLWLALLLAACSQQVALFNNMSERDANEVLASLDRVGITAQKSPGKEGAINLLVAQADVARAVDHLDKEGLPRERRASMGDVFRKEGLISSPLEERARYLWALSQELSETLSQIDGVLTARVHVVLPERSTGGDPALPSSAAVFIKHRRDVDLQPSVGELKRLVVSSIPGLTIEKVNVVLMPAAEVPDRQSEPRAGNAVPHNPMAPVAADPAAQRKAEWALGQQRHLLAWGALGLVSLLCALVVALVLWVRRRRRPQPAGAGVVGPGDGIEPREPA